MCTFLYYTEVTLKTHKVKVPHPLQVTPTTRFSFASSDHIQSYICPFLADPADIFRAAPLIIK